MTLPRITSLTSLLLPLALATCSGTVDTTGALSSGSTSSGTGGSGGSPSCVAGAEQPCYGGPPGTAGHGICKAGMQTCAADGTGFTDCQGEVLPQAEDCATPEDDDCDGVAPSCAPTALWARRAGGVDVQHGNAIAAGPGGEVVITGHFRDTMSFGEPLVSVGVEERTDVFVTKLDASGNHLWSKRFGDAKWQYGSAVAVDGEGNILVGGHFDGSIDFGVATLVAPVGHSARFVAKLDSHGEPQWAKRVENHNGAEDDLAVDGEGNVIIAGTFGGTVDFGGGPLTSEGSSDVFALKLGPDGGFRWAERFGGAGHHTVAVAVDSAGQVVLSGSFEGVEDFGGTTLESAGGKDLFVMRLDPEGQVLWSRSYGDASHQIVSRVEVDAAGDVLLLSLGLTVMKLDTEGELLWSRGLTAPSVAWHGMAVDGAGNVLLTGDFWGVADLGGDPLTSVSPGGDLFVAKLSASGDHVWSGRFGGPGWQAGKAIAADASGDVLFTGFAAGDVDFGTGVLSGVDAYYADDDVIVVKLAP